MSIIVGPVIRRSLAIAAVIAVVVGTALWSYRAEAPQAQRIRDVAAQSAARGSFKYFGVITSDLSRFDNAVGSPADLRGRYLAWGHQLPQGFIESSAREGAQTMIEILPRGILLRKIASGLRDSYLRTLGHEIAAVHAVTRRRLLVSFAPEADGKWYTWGQGHVSPHTYVRAYRHVHWLLSRLAGPDITFVWQMSHLFPTSEPLRKLWPGPRYVSLVGIDGYFYVRTDTFRNVMGTSVQAVRRFTHKPIIISETSVGQVAGQTRKIPLLFAGLRQYGMRGFIWFDHSQNQGLYHQDWQLEGHQRALQEMRAGLRSVGYR
ncbi:MAG: glycosyl hydrolase [Streptosporangiaceae bacterium]